MSPRTALNAAATTAVAVQYKDLHIIFNIDGKGVRDPFWHDVSQTRNGRTGVYHHILQLNGDPYGKHFRIRPPRVP